MLLIDDHNLFERCNFLRDHGRAPGTYFNTEVTCKYMPSNLAASLGYAQFQRIDELVEKKRWIWRRFCEEFKNTPDVHLNVEPKNVYNGVWCPAMVFGHSHELKKDFIMKKLTEKGLPSRPFFYPLTLLPAFGGDIAKGRINSPVAYDISERGINLPCALNLTDEQIVLMSNGIKGIISEHSKSC
jgi:perosamine synthetase